MVNDYLGALAGTVSGKSERYLNLDEIVESHSSNVRWDRELMNNLRRQKIVKFSTDKIWRTQYRAFTKQNCYVDYLLVSNKYQMDKIFPSADSENRAICVPGVGSTKPFSVLDGRLECRTFI